MNENNQIIGILKIKLDYSLDYNVKLPFMFSPENEFKILNTKYESFWWKLWFKPISINNEGIVFGKYYGCFSNLKEYALFDPTKNNFSHFFDCFGHYDKDLICFNNNSTVMGNIYHWDFEAKHDIVRTFHYDSANSMVFPEIGFLNSKVKAANDLNCMIGETQVLVERGSSNDDFPWETSIWENEEEDEGDSYRVKWVGYFRDENGLVEIIEKGTPVLINNNNKVLCVDEKNPWIKNIFLWDRKKGEKSIQKLLAPSFSNWWIEDVLSINDRDEILAVGRNLETDEDRLVLLVPSKE